jgi:hypothetical protein
VYTHLYVAPADAKKLFLAFARKPLQPGQSGVVTRESFEEHFDEFSMTYLPKLEAALHEDSATDGFVLKFGRYLAELPSELVDLEVVPTMAEIVRMNSAPTRARAGYYKAPRLGCSATVERIRATKPVTPSRENRLVLEVLVDTLLNAQNIWVYGPTLEAAQKFNSKLSTGSTRRFLVNAFE